MTIIVPIRNISSLPYININYINYGGGAVTLLYVCM